MLSIDSSQLEPTTSTTKRHKLKKKKRKWTTKKLNPSRQAYKCSNSTKEPNIIQSIRHNNLKPIDMFKLCFNDDTMKLICIESIKYTAQKSDSQFTLLVDDLYKYFGILLFSGYYKMPFRRMYRQTRPDANCYFVSQSMSRNKFEKIHQFLHFNDNSNIDETDKAFKTRPLLIRLNDFFHQSFLPLSKSYSLDDDMEPYYGHYAMKQFIRGKPIRYGFKFWCLTSPEGYMIKIQPYTGGNKIEGKTVGESVTENLCLGFVLKGSCIFMDNYFTSLSLMDTLSSEDLFCVGTIRSDRIENAPLKDVRKAERGTCSSVDDKQNNISLVRWNDNNQVTLITNLKDNVLFEVGNCKGWKRKERKRADVPQPNLIKLYNKKMGGVDLFD